MQRRKIAICLSLLLMALAIPAATIPKAHAFFNGNIHVTLGNIIKAYTDPNTNTVDAATAGSTLTVSVSTMATAVAYQRNVTMGFKGDWMSQYQNATNASPTSTLPLTANQVGTATISVTLPTTGAIAPAHSWSVAVWDGPANQQNGANCATGRTERTASCETISNFQAGYNGLAIFTSDQFAAAQADIQSTSVIDSVTSAIATLQFHTSAPGVTAAAGQLAQAQSEKGLARQSWMNGDFAGAKTHFQNALNDANAAAGSLLNQGGGVDNATLLNLVLGGTGLALIGIGALFAGIGAFFYLRRRPKA